MSVPEIKFTKLFINNEWCNSVDGAKFPTINPSTEEVIVQIEEGKENDIDAAVLAAKEAFKFGSEWRTMDASHRGLLLLDLADLIEKEADYISKVEALDNGKTPSSALGDIEFAVRQLRYYAGFADKITGTTSSPIGNHFCYTRIEPVGVVGAIIPWNYPFAIAVQKIAPAIASGCTIVLKPAEQTPLTALILGDLVVRAGFPKGVVNIVPGYGPTAGAALAKHKDVNKITFTGSTEIGHLIMVYAGQTNLKRVTLELGGKSPLIIFADAYNLDEAAMVASEACMVNHGQCCCAGTRTFVEASIYDVMVEKLKVLAEKRIVGNQFDDKTIQGPQIDKQQFDKIMHLIESGKSDGAKLVTGGGRLGNKGYFIKPTVFCDVKDNMRIAKEEIFGPVQSILKFHTLEEVIKRANDTHYGLGAGVFTSDINKIMMTSQALEAGSVWVNCYNVDEMNSPFGGFKQSGIGRELYALKFVFVCDILVIAIRSKYGLDGYCEVKSVTIAVPQKNS